MQESIGHCGSAEIPIVIIDCQRAGPSTGMPTKPEQSDINMLTRGGNGDFPHIVLAPGDPALPTRWMRLRWRDASASCSATRRDNAGAWPG